MKLFCLFTFLILALTGCASTQDYERQAAHHDKAREYYNSIGQPQAAKEENELSIKSRDDADDLLPIVVTLFDIFKKKDK